MGFPNEVGVKCVSTRVLYIVSLFPCWSETFIVREINEMIRLGVDVRIMSLKPASEKMVQSDAAALADRVIYPASFAKTLFATLGALVRHPVRELSTLCRIFLSMHTYPQSLAKTLVVWWRTLGLLAVTKEISPRHIHAHWATYPSTAAWLLSERLSIPFSFTAHAHDIFLENHLLSQKMRTAAFTVAISTFNRDYLMERVAEASTAKINIVHCGVSPDLFPMVIEGRREHQLLAIGRLDEIKGFVYLVEACALLKARGVSFQCDIVGSGPLEPSMRQQITTLNLESHVQLLGARKQEEVRAMLQSASLFVLPSVVTSRGDRDGIPVALMEAMASGTPVISTRVSGIPELIEHDVTGLLATPGDAASLADAIERLLIDPSLRLRLVKAARGRVEQEFDSATEARKLYDAILKS
jgi:colanic acid/amylovoran biosynthesis glycosyltransferase